MRYSWLPNLLLLSAGCLAGHPGAAQKSAVAPLAPRQLMGPLPTGPAGVLGMPTYSPTRPTAPADQLRATSAEAPPEPVIILNNKVLGAMAMLAPQEIEAVMVYKDPHTTPPQWRSLAGNGILAIMLKPKVRVKSWQFVHLAQRLKLRGPVSYSFNGLPMDDGHLRIATKAIGKITLTRTAAGTALDVSTQVAPKKVYPPGTIMIRGMAAR